MSSEPLNQTTDRIARMRQTWKEITESDGGECQMMADYRWACDEIEWLMSVRNLGRRVCGQGTMNCSGAKLMKDACNEW